MLDAEVPAGVNPASGRVAGSGAAASTNQRRPLLVAGSFVVAVLLGIAIGLVWAPDEERQTVEPAAEQLPTDLLSQPSLTVPLVNGVREPGKVVKVTLTGEEPTKIRTPLEWLAAHAVRQQTGAATPVADDALILPSTLYVGAVQGVDREHDVFWAAGITQINGVSEAQAPNPHVWKREGDALWTLAGRGPEGCKAIPADLLHEWTYPHGCTEAALRSSG